MLEKGKECFRKGKDVTEMEIMLEKGKECWRKGKNVGERGESMETEEWM
jgi:hypothetical protein